MRDKLLKRLWTRWKRFAEAVGNFQARLLLTALYFVLLAPVALPLRAFGDPLRRRPRGASFWLPRPVRPGSLAGARRQH
jgi:hypothetical protein